MEKNKSRLNEVHLKEKVCTDKNFLPYGMLSYILRVL